MKMSPHSNIGGLIKFLNRSSEPIIWSLRGFLVIVLFALSGMAQAGSSAWVDPLEYPNDSADPFPDWLDSSHWAGDVIPDGQGDIAYFTNLTERLNLRITDFSNGINTPGAATTITLGGIDHSGAGRIDSRERYGPSSTARIMVNVCCSTRMS